MASGSPISVAALDSAASGSPEKGVAAGAPAPDAGAPGITNTSRATSTPRRSVTISVTRSPAVLRFSGIVTTPLACGSRFAFRLESARPLTFQAKRTSRRFGEVEPVLHREHDRPARGDVRLEHAERRVGVLHPEPLRLLAPPSVDRPPVPVAPDVPVRHVEHIVHAAPDRAAERARLLPHQVHHAGERPAPVLADPRVGHQLAAVVALEVRVLAEPDRAGSLLHSAELFSPG